MLLAQSSTICLDLLVSPCRSEDQRTWSCVLPSDCSSASSKPRIRIYWILHAPLWRSEKAAIIVCTADRVLNWFCFFLRSAAYIHSRLTLPLIDAWSLPAARAVLLHLHRPLSTTVGVFMSSLIKGIFLFMASLYHMLDVISSSPAPPPPVIQGSRKFELLLTVINRSTSFLLIHEESDWRRCEIIAMYLRFFLLMGFNHLIYKFSLLKLVWEHNGIIFFSGSVASWTDDKPYWSFWTVYFLCCFNCHFVLLLHHYFGDMCIIR